MRVLLVCDFHLKYSVGLARGLAEHGADVLLLSRTHDWEFGGQPGAMRAWVTAELQGRAAHARIPGRVRDPRALRALVAARALVRRFAPDVVHLQDDVNADVRLLAAAAPRGRYAVTVHDPALHPGDPHQGPVYRWLKREVRRRAGLLFVHASALRDELMRLESPAAPIEIVPHGAAPAAMVPMPPAPALLFFGRMSHYKGLDVLLDAMPLVWQRLPRARLTVAGEGAVEDHPVLHDQRVTFRNEHISEAEVADLYGGATCVVLPYREASQSGVGSRAKHFGRPLVASALGGLPELVDGAGRLVPPEDPPALADALVEVLATPQLAERLGRAAAESLADASWPRVAELTLAAYERHLAS